MHASSESMTPVCNWAPNPNREVGGGGESVEVKPIFHCDAKYLASGLALGNAPDARIWRWRYQHVGIFWCYLTLKFALAPPPNPAASQWNIGGIGPSGVGAGVGHVHFMFFCVDFICVL